MSTHRVNWFARDPGGATTYIAPSDQDNDFRATGMVFAVLEQFGLDPQVVEDDDMPTNALTVRLPQMASRYRITVERVPES